MVSRTFENFLRIYLSNSKVACGPSKWKMAIGLTNLKMAFGPGLKMFFEYADLRFDVTG